MPEPASVDDGAEPVVVVDVVGACALLRGTIRDDTTVADIIDSGADPYALLAGMIAVTYNLGVRLLGKPKFLQLLAEFERNPQRT